MSASHAFVHVFLLYFFLFSLSNKTNSVTEWLSKKKKNSVIECDFSLFTKGTTSLYATALQRFDKYQMQTDLAIGMYF